MTTRFLDDKAFGSAIAEIVDATNARCAAGLWGTGAIEKLSGAPGLRAMKARGNRRLKHVERLHAKLYLSDRGAMICSAHASDNGIGFVDGAGPVGAEVFSGPDTNAYADARGWFDRISRWAKAVSQPVLDPANTAWNNRSHSRRLGCRFPRERHRSWPRLRRFPSYRRIEIVFTNGRATRKQRKRPLVCLCGRMTGVLRGCCRAMNGDG